MKKAILLLIILAGCQFMPQMETPSQREELYTGTEGLDLEIMKHPERVFPGQTFNIIVLIKNKGAHETENAIHTQTPTSLIKTQGWVQYTDETRKNENEFSLTGKTRANPYGGQVRVEYRYEAGQPPEKMQSYTAPLLYQVCYPYKTFLTTPVCIDPDVNDLNPDKPCKPEMQTFTGQGGPVAVTSVNPIMVPRSLTEIQGLTAQERRAYSSTEGGQAPREMTVPRDAIQPIFEITIQNVGDGQIMQKGQATRFCKGQLENVTGIVDKVNVYAKLSDKELSCNGRQYGSAIGLARGTGMIRCTLAEEDLRTTLNTPTYTTPLQVELEYDYISTEGTTVTIEQY